MALDILTENRVKLDALAAVLLEKETLDREEVEKFFGDVEKRAPREAEERSAGLAVTRASQKKRERRPSTPGTLGRSRPRPRLDRSLPLAVPSRVRVECGRPRSNGGET